MMMKQIFTSAFVILAPSAVQNVTHTPGSSIDIFLLSWQPPSGGCEVMQYRYQLKHNNNLVTAGQTSNTSLVFSNLMSCSKYVVIISAVNAASVKGASTTSMFMTGKN